jgi:hypothetical protein
METLELYNVTLGVGFFVSMVLNAHFLTALMLDSTAVHLSTTTVRLLSQDIVATQEEGPLGKAHTTSFLLLNENLAEICIHAGIQSAE